MDRTSGSGQSPPHSVICRAGAPADAGPAARLIVTALNDVLSKQNRAPTTSSHGALVPVLEHLAKGAGRFWVAADGEDLVGMGTSLVRGELWFLSALFVLPQWQGAGVGRALLEHAMDGYPAAGGVAAVMSSAANPLSNRLYAHHGLWPLMPVLYLSGAPARVVAPHTSSFTSSPLSVDHLDDLRAVDLGVTGLDRTPDHAWLMEVAGRPGWLFRRHGRPAGYAYLGGDGTQGDDAVGPVATLRAQDQAAAIGFALAEAARRGHATATLAVPGLNLCAQRLLWQAGFAFEGAAALFGASRPFGRFDRYIFFGDSLM